MLLSEAIYEYNTIPFRLFLKIAETGDINLLVRKGIVKEDKLSDCWEQIIKENKKHTGNTLLSTYMELSQDHLILLKEHTIIKSALIILMIKPENELALEALVEYGYHLNKKDMINSILNGLNNSNNIITHIQMKQNEIAL